MRNGIFSDPSINPLAKVGGGGNPNHDELGRFADAGTTQAAAKPKRGSMTYAQASALVHSAVPFGGAPGNARAMSRQITGITKGLVSNGVSPSLARSIIDSAQSLQAQHNRGGTLMFIQAGYFRDTMKSYNLIHD